MLSQWQLEKYVYKYMLLQEFNTENQKKNVIIIA